MMWGFTARRNGTHALPLLGTSTGYATLIGLAVITSVCCLPSQVALTMKGIRDHSIGALYVVNFVVFAGASAGAVLVGTLAGASQIERWRPLIRIAEIGAIGGFVLATIFVALCRFHPRGIVLGGETVASTWSVPVVSLYLGNAMALGYFVAQRGLLSKLAWLVRARSARELPLIARAALARPRTAEEPVSLGSLSLPLIPAVVFLHAVSVWIFAASGSETEWSTLGRAALFYTSMVISGLALVVAAATASGSLLGLQIADDVLRDLATILALAAPVLGFCFFAEIATMVEASGAAGRHLFSELVVGEYAPVFWSIEMVGVIVPFVLLAAPERVTTGGAGLAAFLIVLGTLIERWTLIVPPLLGHAHLFSATGTYHLVTSELRVTVGAYAFGLLLCLPLPRALGLVDRRG